MNYKYYPERPSRLTAEFVREEYASLTARIEGAENAETADAWLALYDDWNALKAYVNGEGSRINFNQSKDMNDPRWDEADRYYREEVMPAADNGNSVMVNALLGSRHKDGIAEKYGEYLIRALKTSVEPLAPINSDLRVKASDLVNRYDKLVASGEVMVKGEKVTLAVARSMQSSEDADTRKEAFFAHRAWYLENHDELASIFDQLVKLRDQMGRNLGHDNFIPLGYNGMGRTDYGPEDVSRFRESIRRFAVPLQKKLFERQASELGAESLKPWDAGYTPSLTLPSGIAPVEMQLEKAQRVFDSLSPELGGHFARMRQEGLIDLENRKGKRAGAYCTSFPDEGRVAIFCNSTGDEGDVSTLMHEMGHAFQGWESQPIPTVDLQWPTSDACEVHSMGMEYLSMRHMDEFFSEEHVTKYRRSRWKDSVEIICYIAVVDEFQHWVYQNPNVTTEERDRKWNELWDVYKPGIDFGGMDDYKQARWYAQGHIYWMPFYYIDYAIAETGAMQLALMDAEDHERAMETYIKLCRIGGTMSVLDIFKAAGLRSPFDPQVMSELMAHAASELGISMN